MAKNSLMIALAVAGSVLLSQPFNAVAKDGDKAVVVDVVKQIIDLNATTSYEAFRFEPDYLRIEPNTIIRFTGSLGKHTVTSVRGMYPEGARPFEIRNRPEMDIPFEKEGVYGIRCRIHGRHGMAMLVVVGDPRSNLEKARIQRVGKKEAVKFKNLFDRLDADIAKGAFDGS